MVVRRLSPARVCVCVGLLEALRCSVSCSIPPAGLDWTGLASPRLGRGAPLLAHLFCPSDSPKPASPSSISALDALQTQSCSITPLAPSLPYSALPLLPCAVPCLALLRSCYSLLPSGPTLLFLCSPAKTLPATSPPLIRRPPPRLLHLLQLLHPKVLLHLARRNPSLSVRSLAPLGLVAFSLPHPLAPSPTLCCASSRPRIEALPSSFTFIPTSYTSSDLQDLDSPDFDLRYVVRWPCRLIASPLPSNVSKT